MFAWRKKPDGGFEWHEYIRTAVRHRRELRRQRVQDARRAAGQQMHAAGAALAAGSIAAGSAARDGARAGAGALGLALQAAWSLLVHSLRVLLRPIVEAVARPNIGGPLALAGAIALGAGIGRSRSAGLDSEAVTTLLIGVVLMAALLPMLARTTNWRLPRLSGRAAVMAAGFLVLIGGAAWFASGAGFGKLAAEWKTRLGIETGIDLDRLCGVARRVEEVIGRPLPGQVMKAGPRLRLSAADEVRTAVG